MKANFKIPQQNIEATFVPSKNSYTARFSIPAGGGVSSDYLLLFNKPLINGVELVRDKNSLELGLASYKQGLLADSALQPNDNISELVNNVGYITGITSSDIQTALGYIPYSAENPSGFITISALSGYATENWVGQQGYLTSSDLSGYATEQWVNNQGFIKGISNTDVINALGYTPYDNSNPAGYITSESLPTVNNSTITIQKNGSDIESFNLNQPTNETINITVPTQTSDLTNNSGFITNAVNNLTNYYLKSETYTKTEVQQLIASIPQFSVVVVQTLPVTGERMVLYLVPKEGASPDVYNEYIWVEADEDYELIGNTAIDLTNYVQFTDLATVATTGDYDDLSNKPTIPTVNNGTLDIQVNGTSVGTFTANQAGNTTANIVVPDSATWGNITGTLSNQTDLQNALDAKYDASNPDGYITSADLPTNHVTTNTAQTISGDKKFTGVTRFQNGSGNGCVILGADVASTTVSPYTRKLGRMSFHTFENTVDCAFVSTDSEGTKNHVEFGGRIGDVTNTSPDVLKFTVAKVHNSTANADKVNALEVSYSGGANFGVQPKYNNKNLATEAWVNNQGFLISSDLAPYVTSTNLTTILADYALTADVPTKTSELTNDSNFATISQIPTVGNGTITINQGGTQKGTFTTNQNGNVTIDLDAGGGGVDVQAYTATEVETLWESI